MKPVAKALWYIESHVKDEIDLDTVADIAGVSSFHLTRAFRFATGYSVMRYVRARRLTEAARTLSSGGDDILSVAVDCGYGSHEAFTRAFREQFGVTPQSVRKRCSLEGIELLEAIRMSDVTNFLLAEPRIVNEGPLLIAGLTRTHRSSNAAMPAQWGEFAPYIGHIPGERGAYTYGVLYNDAQGSIDYLTGVEVSEFSGLPDTFSHLRIPAHRYAVFVHTGHVSNITGTWTAIWSEWFPRSGHEAADAPMFERYPESFDSRTGNGGFEIWIPLK